jgi:hypothetical protein
VEADIGVVATGTGAGASPLDAASVGAASTAMATVMAAVFGITDAGFAPAMAGIRIIEKRAAAFSAA